jgi:hypothetical protein
MSLTEREQRLLDEIEGGLRGDTSDEAEPITTNRSRVLRSLVFLTASTAFGLIIVFVGLITKIVPVSIAGFLLILAALTGSTFRRGGTRRNRASTTARRIG